MTETSTCDRFLKWIEYCVRSGTSWLTRFISSESAYQLPAIFDSTRYHCFTTSKSVGPRGDPSILFLT